MPPREQQESPDLMEEDVGRRQLGLRRSMNGGGIKMWKRLWNSQQEACRSDVRHVRCCQAHHFLPVHVYSSC
ncbi:hypothetical protein BDA96_07G111400 [Sorghum bicolor]|uniref:Uncharacterized protein n=2 Tax=Sorghum bicolor TaxID=4558 RepID=A0A921QMQ8_SORBI|nr:hypothetical protein BDA96_07G111400 [Sorghum bicolor]OQU80284.1 hypothetical protein SORBI_3007G104866 [Sorghum bicolor]